LQKGELHSNPTRQIAATACNSVSGGKNVPGLYLREAAKLKGVDPSTIHRAMKNGRLSFTLDGEGQRVIDPAELDRWHEGYQTRPSGSKPVSGEALQLVEIAQLRAQLEIEKARSAGLLERLADLRAELRDMRGQRDEWQAQAKQLLLTQQTTPAPKKRKWWHLGKRESG
jgi:hypothetical protein